MYAAGDITGGIKQWVVACAEGAVAAISAYNDTIN
jgi:thioredoxin reductase (NADPH)